MLHALRVPDATSSSSATLPGDRRAWSRASKGNGKVVAQSILQADGHARCSTATAARVEATLEDLVVQRARCLTTRRPLYLTTPIFYANAEPHLGHTYTLVVADTLARFWRARGRDVFVVTGTDEHGDKIAQAAAAARRRRRRLGRPHERLVAGRRGERSGSAYDHFVRTTDADHVAFVQQILAEIHARGDIYFDSYTGLYCYGCERFYQERELVDGRLPRPSRRRRPRSPRRTTSSAWRSTRSGSLSCSASSPSSSRPTATGDEVLALLREPIGDLCISRPKSRLTWGIELPFDDRYVTYVWFDALLYYVSARARAPAGAGALAARRTT